MTRRQKKDPGLHDDPLWFKDAIIYELHVKTFFDSNADGIGDFPGLVEKLDYLADLGVTALWLLPFYPSPLRDDGYDIADYLSVNPSYGTLRDFKLFLREAHARGIRVITELVINHTSDQHPWFQRARRAPKGSRHRSYYVWSDSADRYAGARIIFQDFEASNWQWDPVAGQYYWHRFYSHQPDLNFENPEVQREVLRALDYWLDLGIDGLRLDAVPYLYEREDTNCENLPETHAFLKKLRAHVDARYANRMLLAEANQWPEDAAAYFGDGDECHMNFHFPLMPRMFMALQLENSFPITDILEQTPRIRESCQWAVFLRNHDELTLEMVTDEDRDYMVKVYAADPQARVNLGIRRRLTPLVRQRRMVELLHGLLFSMPGTPVLYYGDEIGMGDNIYLGDRHGVRTPMQWSGDRNAGFSRANPQKLYLPVVIDPEYHYESVNVEAQQNNPASFLWWLKRLIALRKEHRVLSRGDVEMLDPENSKVLAFVRRDAGAEILCVANLSRFSQYTELELSRYAGTVPVELFGATEFPAIGERPYLLTLGPHQFYWFLLRRPAVRTEPEALATVTAETHWESLLQGRPSEALEPILAGYLGRARWFRGKARPLKETAIVESAPIPTAEGPAHLLLVRAEYVDGGSELYVLPVALATGAAAERLEKEQRSLVLCRVEVIGGEPASGLLHDPFTTPAFARALLDLLLRRRTIATREGTIRGTASREIRKLRDEPAALEPRPAGVEQTNTSLVYGNRLFLKLYRMLEEGTSPELEIGRFLAERAAGKVQVPPFHGQLSYEGRALSHATLALLSGFVPSQGDAWAFTQDALRQYFERALTKYRDVPAPVPSSPLLDLAAEPVLLLAAEAIGPYLPLVGLLAQRTAELHLALATEPEDSAFAPQPFTELHQRSLYQAARTHLRQTFKLLRGRHALERIPEPLRDQVRATQGRRDRIDAVLKRVVPGRIAAFRTRVHGDFHLGQVLFTGKDFVIIDFEGEPARPLSERRFKRSPLRDVAGMIRSFHYASVAALHHGSLRAEDVPLLAPWAEAWHRTVAAAYLRTYLDRVRGALLVPPHPDQLRVLLDFYLLDKCIYELAYELNHRPAWLGIPLRGLADLLGEH